MLQNVRVLVLQALLQVFNQLEEFRRIILLYLSVVLILVDLHEQPEGVALPLQLAEFALAERQLVLGVNVRPQMLQQRGRDLIHALCLADLHVQIRVRAQHVEKKFLSHPPIRKKKASHLRSAARPCRSGLPQGVGVDFSFSYNSRL